jgi:hypothetical protein
VAVGFYDSPAVNLLSGTDLKFLSAPITKDVNNDLSKIAWSFDGSQLYAGGRADDKNGKKFIRRWSQGGLGSAKDFPVADDTIMDLAPLPDGRLAFGAADPAWGVLDAAGRVQPRRGPDQADLRANESGFRLAPDGGRVRFGLQYGGKTR